MQNLRNTSEPPFDLGHFIRDRFASLCAVAASLTGDSEAAKDIAQEVIIKFWENRAQYDKLESVENYLFIMVRNEALNYMRSLRREKKRHEKLERMEEADDSLWNNIMEQEANFLLNRAIDILPPQAKRIVELSLLGKSIREIADELEIAYNTVKVLKNRAIHKLREHFKKNNIRIDF